MPLKSSYPVPSISRDLDTEPNTTVSFELNVVSRASEPCVHTGTTGFIALSNVLTDSFVMVEFASLRQMISPLLGTLAEGFIQDEMWVSLDSNLE